MNLIIGFIEVSENAVTTHRDSYLLSTITAVSVRRPFLSSSLLTGGAFLAFGAAFSDLLYPGEIAAITGLSASALLAGSQLGRLKLLSRDLKDTELSDVVWGQYRQLQEKRLEIADAIQADQSGGMR